MTVMSAVFAAAVTHEGMQYMHACTGKAYSFHMDSLLPHMGVSLPSKSVCHNHGERGGLR